MFDRDVDGATGSFPTTVASALRVLFRLVGGEGEKVNRFRFLSRRMHSYPSLLQGVHTSPDTSSISHRIFFLWHITQAFTVRRVRSVLSFGMPKRREFSLASSTTYHTKSGFVIIDPNRALGTTGKIHVIVSRSGYHPGMDEGRLTAGPRVSAACESG